MEIRNRKVVFSIVGVILLLGLTAQSSFVSAGNSESFSIGSNQLGVEFTGINDSGKDISGFTIEIEKSGRITIAGVSVESDQNGGCGDWDVDDDEDGRSQEEMEYDDWDDKPKSGKTMWTWYTRVDCMGKDGIDGVPIRTGEQYTIRIRFTEKTKNKTRLYIYASNEEDFQIAGTDTIGQEKNEPEKAARMLSDKILIPETSEVFFVGPVGPGTVVRENRPADDQDPVELEVPETSGTYYAFYIDDMPGFKFVHKVRYAWVNIETGEYAVVNALWAPLISEPGATPAPFGLICMYQIKGVKYNYGEGGGSGYVNYIDHKTEARVPKGKGDLVHLPPPAVHMPYNCIALVIDGGDKDPDSGTDRWNKEYDGLADQFFRDADSVEHYLRVKGVYVQRISQYWNCSHPTIRYDPSGTETMNVKLERIIQGLAKIPFVDEFFLYIGAHGNENGFGLFDPTGSGGSEFIPYSKLSEWLSEFPKEVNIVIFIDSCRSGGAIDKLMTLANERTGLTIMTATDDEGSAPGGERSDSFTKNFMEGEDKDLNKNGKKGDLGDLWKSMESQGGKINPQLRRVGKDSVLGPVYQEFKKVLCALLNSQNFRRFSLSIFIFSLLSRNIKLIFSFYSH